jgi:HrpA-like RNA helicase
MIFLPARLCLSLSARFLSLQELGRLAVHLPVDLPLVKLILVGRACGCVNEAVVMAASLSMEDVFSMPHVVIMRNQADFVTELTMNFASRLRFDGGRYSEPLMYLSCYGAFLASNRSQNWARRNSVSLSRMNQLNALVANLASKLRSVLAAAAAPGTRGDTGEFAASSPAMPYSDPALASLERLQMLARSRGMVRMDEVNDMLVRAHEEDVLRFVIAAACAPTFLHGTAKRASNFPSEEECEKLRLALNRTVLMTGIPRVRPLTLSSF